MAEAPAAVKSGTETSQWGLPLSWDGHDLKPYPFFVTAVVDIEPDGWKYIKESTNLSWVIIPHRSQDADYNE